tara:strand:+ start:1594 stop:1725 length:132 start_codon:yes stop_codon:yes gene_type:complete
MVDVGELDNSIQGFDEKLGTRFKFFLNDQKSFGRLPKKHLGIL